MPTAVHMWRFYFRYANRDPDKMTEPNKNNWNACDRAIKKFTDTERDVINKYYMTGYGKYEDMTLVAAYSYQTGISKSDIWELIKKANYEVIVERGLMDRREGSE